MFVSVNYYIDGNIYYPHWGGWEIDSENNTDIFPFSANHSGSLYKINSVFEQN